MIFVEKAAPNRPPFPFHYFWEQIMGRIILIILFIASWGTNLHAAGPFELERDLKEMEAFDLSELSAKENKRAMGATLAVLLGPFGGHRIYYGTDPIVPILYVATLGGGFFILPLIDLGHILFSKDISPYENNGKFFMWRKDSE